MIDAPAPNRIAGDFSAKLVAAWNAHDMSAFASLFWDDAAFVNVIGMYMHGREEIERHHEAMHASIFRNSTLDMHVEDARSPAPSVIVVHVASSLGADERAPAEVRHAIMTLVIEQRNGEWMIAAAHNTDIVRPAA
jgi:uncharacterized protein (TIGR02246 family)